METDPSSPTPLIPGGDYEYLSEGYYRCMEAEAAGKQPLPTCADALDAYIVPIALERVRLAGLPVPEWYLTSEYFTPPALLYGVNPFARNHLHVCAGDDREDAARKISRSGKFVFCCQEIPAEGVPVSFEMVMGRTPEARFESWAERLFTLFHLPIALVRLIETPSQTYFSAIERLPSDKMTKTAQALLAETSSTEHAHG